MTQTIHPFELSGLGKAPFRFVGMSENAIQIPGGSSRAGGCCDYCSTGIRYEYRIRSNDGKEFKVGCDCVLKLERMDNKLISDVKKAKALFEMKRKQEEHEAKAEERRQKREAELDRQREVNGGLTNAELAAKRQEEELQHRREEWTEKNQWLLNVLAQEYQSDFIKSMVDKVEQMKITDLSDRCVCILRDIYAKSHGRRNSKKYDAAYAAFNSKIGWCDE